MRVFHEIDEDGDWYSAFVAALYRVPYIEVSTISNSIYEFPKATEVTPSTPRRAPLTSSPGGLATASSST